LFSTNANAYASYTRASYKSSSDPGAPDAGASDEYASDAIAPTAGAITLVLPLDGEVQENMLDVQAIVAPKMYLEILWSMP
jgi:hypothetical protein